MTRIKQE